MARDEQVNSVRRLVEQHASEMQSSQQMRSTGRLYFFLAGFLAVVALCASSLHLRLPRLGGSLLLIYLGAGFWLMRTGRGPKRTQKSPETL